MASSQFKSLAMETLKSRLMITGGAGFIGSHLANALIDNGYQVIIVDDLSKGKKENINPKATFFKVDIKNKKFHRLLRKIKPNYLFHLAAQSSLSKSIKDPKEDLEINLLAIVDFLKEAKAAKVQKIIFASSAAIYGPVDSLLISEDDPKMPISPYGIAKFTAEHFIRYFCQNFNLPYVSLRFANVYGQNQDTTSEGGVVGIFINKILKKQPVVIYGDGNQTRDFIHVSDVVNASKSVINSKIIGEFNVGTARKTSINDLFAIITKVSGSKPKLIYEAERNMEVKHNSLSYQKINKAIGWRPKVELEEGLKITFEDFKSKL